MAFWKTNVSSGSLLGQGATEYLILLAIVLVISLVAISLLGFYPNLATDAKITQSNSYWRNEARPFSIIEYDVGNASITLVMRSEESSGVLRVNGISLGNAVAQSLPASFSPGETKTLAFSNFSDGSGGISGLAYDIPVVISYTTSNGINNTQAGLKNLFGRYS